MRIDRWMRRAALLAVLAAPAARGQEGAAKPRATPDRWKSEAAAYRIETAGRPPAPLALRAEPALIWTNPQRETDDGAFFLWADRGRPEVAASFYRYRGDGRDIIDHEFVSLARSPLSARRDGAEVWAPSVGGLDPAPIPGAPEPASTPSERLRQMKALARDFHAFFNDPAERSEIRPLPQPLHRDEVEGKRGDVLDGAVFAYVLTTDPEALLLIEARTPAAGGRTAWHFGFARMSMAAMRAEHRGLEVWSVARDDRPWVPTRPYYLYGGPVAP